MKKTIKSILILLGIGIIIYFGVLLLIVETHKEMSNNSQTESCDFNIQSEFEGEILEIERYEFSEYMKQNFFGIKIITSTPSDSLIDLQFNVKENEDLINYIFKGQRIKKNKGKSKFEIELQNGSNKKFSMPNCN